MSRKSNKKGNLINVIMLAVKESQAPYVKKNALMILGDVKDKIIKNG